MPRDCTETCLNTVRSLNKLFCTFAHIEGSAGGRSVRRKNDANAMFRAPNDGASAAFIARKRQVEGLRQIQRGRDLEAGALLGPVPGAAIADRLAVIGADRRRQGQPMAHSFSVDGTHRADISLIGGPKLRDRPHSHDMAKPFFLIKPALLSAIIAATIGCGANKRMAPLPGPFSTVLF